MQRAFAAAGTLLPLLAYVATAPALRTTGDHLSPSEVIADSEGRTLSIAEATAQQIAVFDVASGKVTRTISLPSEVGGLAFAKDDSTLYVTDTMWKGQVFIVNARAGATTDEISAGHTPGAIALGPVARSSTSAVNSATAFRQSTSPWTGIIVNCDEPGYRGEAGQPGGQRLAWLSVCTRDRRASTVK